MRSNFEMVEEFHEMGDQEVKKTPEFPEEDVQDLRIDLIQEEFMELIDAIDDKDIVEVADALTDLLYVVYGAGHAFGIDLDACFREVHRSNMSKGINGKLKKASSGKVLKGKNYSPPDLKSVLFPDTKPSDVE